MWIEPELGRVVRSTLRPNMADADAEIDVAYASASGLGGVWVPVEVRESCTSDTQKLAAVARYRDFRMVRIK